jgi:hypothetical protein
MQGRGKGRDGMGEGVGGEGVGGEKDQVGKDVGGAGGVDSGTYRIQYAAEDEEE